MRTFLAASLIAILPMAASAGTIAASPAGEITLGDKPVAIMLSAQGAPRGRIDRCFVVVEGMTAIHPVGTSYDISLAGTGMAATRAGTISFYSAIGLAPAGSAPLSFEVSKDYCEMRAVVVTVRPLQSPNPSARPALGRISLVAH